MRGRACVSIRTRLSFVYFARVIFLLFRSLFTPYSYRIDLKICTFSPIFESYFSKRTASLVALSLFVPIIRNFRKDGAFDRIRAWYTISVACCWVWLKAGACPFICCYPRCSEKPRGVGFRFSVEEGQAILKALNVQFCCLFMKKGCCSLSRRNPVKLAKNGYFIFFLNIEKSLNCFINQHSVYLFKFFLAKFRNFTQLSLPINYPLLVNKKWWRTKYVSRTIFWKVD